MSRVIFFIIGVAVSALCTVTTQATTINFEDVVVAGAFTVDDPTDSQGFRFTPVGGVIAAPGGCIPDCADNGSQYLWSNFDGEIPSISMTPLGGGLFDLLSFDVAEMFSAPGSASGVATLDVIGSLFGGGTVMASFTLDGMNDGPGGNADFETFFLPGTFVGLTAVVFDPTSAVADNDAMALDNLVVVRIHEPMTVVIFVIGLAALSCVRGLQTSAIR